METKQEATEAFRAWILQRPGLEPGNYINPYRNPGIEALKQYRREVSSYRSEQRSIIKDRHRALKALGTFQFCEYNRDRMLKALNGAYSGRLSWTDKGFDYCTGQYWPTEYRKAAATVLEYYIHMTEREGANDS